VSVMTSNDGVSGSKGQPATSTTMINPERSKERVDMRMAPMLADP
jgi:hypothetical protein